jgi:hypothetical protein
LGSGHSIDGGLRSRMETAFGHNFSRVRIHTGFKAAGLSRSLNARAFTIGSDIAFASGEYRPGTVLGDALIAHELAHTVQQEGAGGSIGRSQKIETESSYLERDADESAMGVVASLWDRPKSQLSKLFGKVIPRVKSGLRLQRCASGDCPPGYHWAVASAVCVSTVAGVGASSCTWRCMKTPPSRTVIGPPPGPTPIILPEQTTSGICTAHGTCDCNPPSDDQGNPYTSSAGVSCGVIGGPIAGPGRGRGARGGRPPGGGRGGGGRLPAGPTPPRQLPPGPPTTAPPSRQLPPGPPTTTPPSRQLPPGPPTTAPPSRQLPPGPPSTAPPSRRVPPVSARPAPGGAGARPSYRVSPARRVHILEGDPGRPGSGHGPRRGNTRGAFPDTWTDDQAIAAIERVADSPGSTWRQSTGPGMATASITTGGPAPGSPIVTSAGTPVRFEVRGRDHGLDITVIVEPGPSGSGIVTGYVR